MRTAGQAATREAPWPCGLGAQWPAVTSRPVQQHLLVAVRARRRRPRPCRAASRAWPATSSGVEPARAPARPPGGTARRCRAGASRTRCATARLIVPLPEPLGPSMVTTGAVRRSCASRSAGPPAAGDARETRERRSRHWRRRGSRSAPRAAQPGHRERHGDAVIAVAVDRAAAQGRAAAQPQAVGEQLVLDPEHAQPCAMAASRSLSLTRSSSAPRTSVSPFGSRPPR